jgi:transposase
VKDVLVANTHKLKMISTSGKKTDKIDAEKLAVYPKMRVLSRENLFEPVHVPEKIIQDLRGLFTTYRLLRKQIGQIKNRIHSLYKQELRPFTKEYIFGKKTRKMLRATNISPTIDFQLSLLFDELERLEKTIEELERYVKYLSKPYEKEIEILVSMKGISIFTAIALNSDIADISRFPNSKKLTSYLRSAPGVHASNETVKNLKTTKWGRKVSITLISQSLNHFRDENDKMKEWYEKKTRAGMHRGKIRMAMCRRVFTEIYQMLKKKEYHYFMDKNNFEKKMKEYRDFHESYVVDERYRYFKECA